MFIHTVHRFYGGTESLVDAYKARGIESFGMIEYGSCGYTLSDGTLAYPRELYAALAGEARGVLKPAAAAS